MLSINGIIIYQKLGRNHAISSVTNNYFNTQNMQLIKSYHYNQNNYNQNEKFTVNRSIVMSFYPIN